MALYFDGVRVGSDVTGRTGKFNTRFRVPAGARPGDHPVDAVAQSSGVSAQALFLVRTDWLQGCFGGGRSCFNPYENVIGRGNAGALAGDDFQVSISRALCSELRIPARIGGLWPSYTLWRDSV